MKSKAAILTKRSSPLVIDEIDLPKLKEDQVLVQMKFSGICHTQLSRIKALDTKVPALLGHEGVGYIRDVGSAVLGLKVDDLVALSWLTKNPSSKANLTYLSWQNRTIESRVATWTSYAVINQNYAYKLGAVKPSTLEEVAILGCAVVSGAGAVQNALKLRKGQTIVVLGAGGVGLCAVKMAKALGAKKIFVVDTHKQKLNLAKKLGADEILVNELHEVEKKVFEMSGGGVDLALDCVGKGESLEQCLRMLKPGVAGKDNFGGTVGVLGLGSKTLHLSTNELVRGHKRVVGVLGDALPEADFSNYLKVGFGEVVTNKYPLEKINEACQDLADAKVLGRAVVSF